MRCSLGQLLDLSLGGARVMARRPAKGATAVVRIWDDQGGLETEVCVAWQRRHGFFRHEIGIRFPPLDDVARGLLQRFASDHRFKGSFGEADEGREAA